MSQGTDQSPDAHLSAVLKETYRIDQLLGKGGMGAVYQATHLRLGSKVAVKLLLSGISGNPEVQHRFRREAKVAMDLSDENIVHIHDYDVTPDGTPFIVMEYLEGEDLSAMINREAPLHLERVVEIARQIGSALTAAHGQGVVHRDLKPENIFLKKRASGEAVVKVVDFGIAKVMDSESMVTRTGALMGTPCFMAPEQARQEARTIDGRADIFSFGCILYYMLSGQLPFYGEKYAQVLLQIISREPPPLRSQVPRLPREVELVVNRALAKDPAERFQNVDLMMHSLVKAAGMSWGSTGDYVETVVTGHPSGLADAGTDVGHAETVPPDDPLQHAVTEPGVEQDQASVAPESQDADPASGVHATLGTAPTVAPTMAPAVDLIPSPASIAKLYETPVVETSAQPAARRRFSILLLAVVLILGSGVVTAWLLRERLFPASPGSSSRPTRPTALAEQKWASSDGGRHAGASLGGVDMASRSPSALPADGGTPAVDARIPDSKRARPAPEGRGKPHRKSAPRRAVLTVKVRVGGQDVSTPVFVNGRSIGRSPCRSRVAPGTHMIRVRWLGYAPVDKEVVLKAGQRKAVVLNLD